MTDPNRAQDPTVPKRPSLPPGAYKLSGRGAEAERGSDLLKVTQEQEQNPPPQPEP